MKKDSNFKHKATCFILGFLFAAGLFIILGAQSIHSGAYQISAWAADRVGYGCFIVDTTTGETKTAFKYTGLDDPKIDNLNKPFQSM